MYIHIIYVHHMVLMYMHIICIQSNSIKTAPPTATFIIFGNMNVHLHIAHMHLDPPLRRYM